MCGIVGFVDKKRQLADGERRKLIGLMLESIEHRGRDGAGSFVEGPLALGNARLAIIDPSESGAQPFFDHEKRMVMTYNGEVYNFKQIKANLKDSRQLCSDSDTETIVYAFREHGLEALQSLKGMFAFALYDRTQQVVTLVLDRFGIKPLYIVETDEWLAWSSEAKSLMLLPGFRTTINVDALSEFITFRQVVGETTLFKGIRRMLPAHVCTFNVADAVPKYKKYWNLEKKMIAQEKTEELLIEKLRSAVNDHLVADVPVGIQLSGGVDSSVVVALAAEMKPDLNSYSIGLADDGWNEFEFSRTVAKHTKTNHHELLFSENDFCELLPRLTYHMDEPISHSHSVPMFMLANEARKDVKVLLSGEGADEVFFGYKRYQALFSSKEPRDILGSSAFISRDIAEKVFPAFESSKAAGRFREKVIADAEARGFDWIESTSVYDLATYLPPLLMRQDKMGMAANLENRVPFLDHELVEFGFSLPAKDKISATDNKILLKNIARKILPREIVDRPKIGFGQPIAAWLRNEKGLGRYLTLLGPHRDMYSYESVHKLIKEHLAGKNNTEVLWTLINFELWCRIFIDREMPDAILAKLYG